MSEISTKQYLNGTDVVSGATIVTGGTLMVGYSDDVTIVGGGTAINTVVNGDDAGNVYLSGSGLAEAPITLNTLEMTSGLARISGAANMTDVTLNAGATMSAQNTADGKIQIDGVTVNGGKLLLNPVKSGADLAIGSLTNVTLNGGSISCFRGVVSGATIRDGKWKGYHTQFYDVVISGGVLSSVAGTGLVQNATIYDGYLQLSSGKTSNVTVSGGTLKAFGSAHTTIDTTVYGGTVDFNGFSSKGAGWYTDVNTYSNTVVSGGDVKISGGFVKDLSVCGGLVNFLTKPLEEGMDSGGLILEGTVNLAGGAVTISDMENASWINDTAATWSFNLENRTAEDDALITDFSFTAANGYAISVSPKQESGRYVLANQATATLDQMNFSLSVGGVAVAEGITVNGAKVSSTTGEYTLSISDGDLVLDVVAKEYIPVTLYKNGEVVATGDSFDGITIGGADYDAVVIGEGGTVTNLTYVSGAISVASGGLLSGMTLTGGAEQLVIDYEVYNLNATWSGKKDTNGLVFSSGAIIHGAHISAITGCSDSSVKVGNGAVIYDLVYDNSVNSSLAVSKGGVVSGVTFTGTNKNPIRNRGTVINAEVGSGIKFRFDDSGTLGGGISGATNISGGTLDLAYSSACLSGGMINFYGGTLLAIDSRNEAASIAADTVINLYSGALIKNSTDILLGGTLNFRGGKDSAGTIQDGHSGLTIASGAELNFYAVNAYMTGSAGRYDKFTDASNATFGFVVEGTPTMGTYTLLGGAAAFDGTVTVTVNDEVAGTISVDETVAYDGYKYTLTNGDGKLTVTIAADVKGSVIVYNGDEVGSAADVMTDIVVDGNPHTKISILSGGTANATIVRDGGAFDQQDGIANGVIVSGGSAIFNGGTANNVWLNSGLSTTIANTVNGLSGIESHVAEPGVRGGYLTVAGGAHVSNVDMMVETSSGMVIKGYFDGGTVHAVNHGFSVEATGSAKNLTLYGSARISGNVSDVDVFYDDVHGIAGGLGLYQAGNVGGTVNVHSGAGIVFATVKDSQVVTEGQIHGTVNILSGGSIALTRSDVAKGVIGSGAVVNVFEGGQIFMSTPVAILVSGDTKMYISGTVNLQGGRIVNYPVVDPDTLFEKSGMDITGGTVNYKLVGVEDNNADPFLKSYDNLVEGTKGKFGYCTLDVDTACFGFYRLAGDFSNDFQAGNGFDKFYVNGEYIDYKIGAIGETQYQGGRIYYFDKSDDEVYTLRITAETYDATAGIATREVNSSTVEALWGNSTDYDDVAGKFAAGNALYANTNINIDNEDNEGADKVYVFGGAKNADITGTAKIDLYQGSIGAIMGGAINAANSVGAVRVIVGGGTTTAETKVVYGGGYGSVKGDIKVSIFENASVTGQVYGGPMVMSGTSATVGGDITLILDGGTVASDVIGGARVQADGIGTTTVQDINVNLTGTELTQDSSKGVYAGGWVYGKGIEAARAEGVDYSAENVTVNITADVPIGLANGRGIFGGALVADYGIASVASTTITIGDQRTDFTTVTNVYGGGWAQTGGESNVEGDVKITVTNAFVNTIIGGGAHSNEATIAGTTNVGGNITIKVTDSEVESICAVGQNIGDTLTGSSTITVSGESTIGGAYGVGKGGVGLENTTTFVMNDFTGTIKTAVKHFDDVIIRNNTVATLGAAIEINGSDNWNFDFSGRAAATTNPALTWENGSFEEETVFNFELGSTVADWLVCDLSGNDTKDDAFDNVTFNLTVEGTTISNYKLGSDIGVGSWSGKVLDYDELNGTLAFASYIA